MSEPFTISPDDFKAIFGPKGWSCEIHDFEDVKDVVEMLNGQANRIEELLTKNSVLVKEHNVLVDENTKLQRIVGAAREYYTDVQIRDTESLDGEKDEAARDRLNWAGHDLYEALKALNPEKQAETEAEIEKADKT